ncbi:tRNA (N6-isopentenyl adenosine(37)-C2)-methylthiotransferase MiaB [Candidatus Shapirobacteria bacterium CG08_land_8_20_14_0_20_39_18]|uniref:tRNA-2-methylthio-N(6)-dimethylallyladenosine synthase n=1 Tax=Candidatus Shapirobacteria bacterium CG08_land_8_20_14_0_20_39_18 TaxID=1974883 RepID=A0A2M6XEB4_9BACT|nr:MAG: tRNA (N6-isopentenyl adenosine(37)-C2)-methylthiotransferase MiaB [Candidatus Shapirobacteria bacterium CG08_land_8_20_14_0_20_39_18]PIY64624.1 MAG: tRNA (N6-isopentenyl adenosine(37)-C2)-methylthiotransferase MiaB [Candidatus Shapirobacteria bacterium CG_4_10_14_0_8_um_filter_39_15]PJE68419.1 MAG: tRNA (N6-isopentenyl adenosine(37)-C2)-methylthiotransferase MiaB [Candidatus Shapirobacteria bacterium CG10_big_fil_rev_8_21_14_0_10_38_8]
MKYFVKTFGCQANVADSERIAFYYEQKGYKPAKNIDKADVIIINTCSVRQSAENRVGGLINNLGKVNRTNNKQQRIVLAGCMLRYPQSDLKRKYPGIDEFFKMENIGFNLPALRTDKTHAWVPIMEGCNNFCSYCVVPYARGREKSRPMEEIICEVGELVKRGYREVTLLGQNVNSYGSLDTPDFPNHPDHPDSPFAVLLTRLNKINGLGKIKFMTSNPWDLTDEIIQAIKLPKVDKYLHLAVQSGDDYILKQMNRKYTAKDYLDLIAKIRKEIPNIEIGTDIIVGFPGESEEQFQNTVDLCKKAKFCLAYISEYSPRPGTVAFKMKDDISPKDKQRRWRILDTLINHPK